MQRPQLKPQHRTIAVAITAGLAIGFFALAATRPAGAGDRRPDGSISQDSARAAAAADSLARALALADSVAAADSAAAADSIAAADSVAQARLAMDPLPPPGEYRSGEDPAFAEANGWPVEGPPPLPGAILPQKRIIAYYGNPLSKRMGALGEYEKDEMLRRLEAQADEWRRADPETPVQTALHLIAVVAQADSGVSGKYRTIMRDKLVEEVYGWAQESGSIVFLDIQTGLSDIRELLPRFDHFLTRPDVHIGIDPEFMMKRGNLPGTRIGTIDASDINYATEHLARLVREHDLPPKVLVIHRFTRGMVTNSQDIVLRPEVQIVMHMDGWGAPWLKRDSYKDYVVSEPVQYPGFKIFYHNDTKAGDPLMTPDDLLRLSPRPLYIQYQ
ncbi:MAG TPA: hypothetical protein VHG09_08200 [Longimicrobiales bacterium]|nr:hypothetical protein [Longimicrobiales bacterium]